MRAVRLVLKMNRLAALLETRLEVLDASVPYAPQRPALGRHDWDAQSACSRLYDVDLHLLWATVREDLPVVIRALERAVDGSPRD